LIILGGNFPGSQDWAYIGINLLRNVKILAGRGNLRWCHDSPQAALQYLLGLRSGQSVQAPSTNEEESDEEDDEEEEEDAARIRPYQKRSKSGYKGVSVEKSKSGNRFRARHMVRNLGTFDTAKDAALAYALADIEHKKDDEEEEEVGEEAEVGEWEEAVREGGEAADGV